MLKRLLNRRPSLGGKPSYQARSLHQTGLKKGQFLIQAVERLPEDYRRPFVLKQSGMSPKQISKQLKLPLSIVEERIDLAGQCIKHAIRQSYKN